MTSTQTVSPARDADRLALARALLAARDMGLTALAELEEAADVDDFTGDGFDASPLQNLALGRRRRRFPRGVRPARVSDGVETRRRLEGVGLKDSNGRAA